MANWRGFQDALSRAGQGAGKWAQGERERDLAWEYYQKQKALDLQNAIALERAKAQADMQNPLTQFLTRGKVLDVVKNMSDMGLDISPYANLFGNGQGNVPQTSPSSTPTMPLQGASGNMPPSMPNMPSSGTNVPIPKTFKFQMNPFTKQGSWIPDTAYNPEVAKMESEQKVKEQEAMEARKGLSIETGGKLAMVKQAKKDIQEARNLLFPKGTPESFARGRAWASNLPMSRFPVIGAVIPQALPFSESGQKIYSRLQNAVAAKLRVETGAQANPSEVENILARFGVTSFSNAKAAWDAMQRLEDFMDETINITDPTGRFTKNAGVNQVIGNMMQRGNNNSGLPTRSSAPQGAVGWSRSKNIWVDANGNEVR